MSTELKRSVAGYHQLAEEVESYNHELEATNEELRLINEDMFSTYQEMYRATEIVKKNEELIRSVFNTADIGLCISDQDGRVVKVNVGMMEMFGYAQHEIIGQLVFSLYPAEERHQKIEEYFELCHQNWEIAGEFKAVRHDGSLMYVFMTARTMPLPEGKVYVVKTFRDITENKKREEEMRLNAMLYQTITNNFPSGTIDIIDQDYRIVFTGGQELPDLQHQLADVIGKSIYEIYPDSLANQLSAYLRRSFNGENATFDIEYNGKYWTATAVPLAGTDSRVNQVMLLSQNVTDKRKIDIGLKETHKSLTDFRKALDNSSLVALCDSDGRVTYINNNLYQISGLDEEKAVGQSYQVFKPDFRQLRLYAEMQQVLQQGHIWKGSLKFHRSPDGTPYWLQVSVTPFLDGDNQPYQYLVIANDITDQKLAEEQLTIHNLELKKINNELDRFVYSASHDLRAPLVSILGLLNVAKLDTDEESRKRYFDMMELSVNKLDRFVQEIIDYSRNSRLEVRREALEFAPIIQDIFEHLQFLENGKRVKMEIDIEGESEFYSDKNRIGVIFNNLVSNAIRYQSLRRELSWIKVRIRITKKEALITFADNGQGISKEYLHRIFDMFFRATYDNYGSGLGLYIVKETLAILKGQIHVESQLNVGTTFHIKIPNLVQQPVPELLEASVV